MTKSDFGILKTPPRLAPGWACTAAGCLGLIATQSVLAGAWFCGPTSSWGLDRIDQRGTVLDGEFCQPTSGAGVTIYVVGSGLRYTHIEFGPRAGLFYDYQGGDGVDCDGEGTFRGSLAGGYESGVAKGAAILNVKVGDCAGGIADADLIAGLTLFAQGGSAPGVVLLPALSCDAAVNNAIQAVITAGFSVVVPAGDDGTVLCDPSCTPTAVPDAIVVGATDANDCRAPFSNYGPGVDVFAPGANVDGAGNASDFDWVTRTGSTAYAAAYVAGVAATYLGVDPNLTPDQVHDLVRSRSTPISGCGESMRLVYTGLNDHPVPPPPPITYDGCASATPVTAGDPLMLSLAPPVPFDTQCATTDGPASCGAEKDVWFSYTATHNGWIEIEVSPGAVQTGTSTPFDPEVAVYDLSAGCPPPFGSELTYDVGQTTTTVCGTLTPGNSVPFPVMKGCEYLIRLGGAGGATGQGEITFNRPACPPANPGGDTYRFQVNGNATGVSFNWAIRAQDGSFRTIEGVVPPGTSGDAAAVVSVFADSITTELAALGCSTMTANPEPGKPKRLLIGSASPFELWVGSTDHDGDFLADFECDSPPDGCIDDMDGDWVPDCACAMVATSGVAVIGKSCIFNPTITAVALAGTDCNANDEDDIIDIVDGTSADENENGVPDECEPDPCAADFDGSGDVGFTDLTALLGAWGPCGADPCPADLDGNRDVGFTDLTALLGVWGPCS